MTADNDPNRRRNSHRLGLTSKKIVSGSAIQKLARNGSEAIAPAFVPKGGLRLVVCDAIASGRGLAPYSERQVYLFAPRSAESASLAEP